MASSSKLLALTFTSSLLRCHRLAPSSSSLLPAPPRRLPGPFLSLRFCSSAVDVADAPASAATTEAPGYPWPEWSDFLDKLRAKGYFEQPTPAPRPDSAGGEAATAAAEEPVVAEAGNYPFKDLNRVKNACLKFGRDRFDILGSLPKQDIRAIVECGCPNIFRKPVNSAKKLREFVQVDEGDACSACKLRGSCDKAYVIPNAEDGARTVDVVRILLNYAIDPTSLSGENSVNGGVQESARKLLSELTILSDTTIDPSLPIPVFHTSKKEDKGRKSVAKPGASAGNGRESTATEMKKGDWLCPNCNFLNFARNRHCLECKADGPRKIDAATTEMKMGDWICPQCHFMNFARNKMCFKCEESRPKRQLNPGEWECPSCDFVNFRRNKDCLRCNHEGPENDTQDNKPGSNSWRNTTGADRSRSFDYVGLEDDGSDRDGERRRAVSSRARSTMRRSTGNNREDDNEDILPYEGQRKHVVSRRATPAQRRFTAARKP
uniref:RanBP2-type domain-containing protein n=1 Tax=Leersia perrieri TaxID=77586 RepID=A0A0D9VY18_9ORYZ